MKITYNSNLTAFKNNFLIFLRQLKQTLKIRLLIILSQEKFLSFYIIRQGLISWEFNLSLQDLIKLPNFYKSQKDIIVEMNNRVNKVHIQRDTNLSQQELNHFKSIFCLLFKITSHNTYWQNPKEIMINKFIFKMITILIGNMMKNLYKINSSIWKNL